MYFIDTDIPPEESKDSFFGYTFLVALVLMGVWIVGQFSTYKWDYGHPKHYTGGTVESVAEEETWRIHSSSAGQMAMEIQQRLFGADETRARMNGSGLFYDHYLNGKLVGTTKNCKFQVSYVFIDLSLFTSYKSKDLH